MEKTNSVPEIDEISSLFEWNYATFLFHNNKEFFVFIIKVLF